MAANVFLHYVLDDWFVREVQPRMQGRTFIVRFADDFIIGCEREDDAHRIMAVLPKRFSRYGLTIHPQKSKLIAFARPVGRPTTKQGKQDRQSPSRGVRHIRFSRIHPLLGTIASGLLGNETSHCSETASPHRDRVVAMVS